MEELHPEIEAPKSEDPFAGQRSDVSAVPENGGTEGKQSEPPGSLSPPVDRKLSTDEWGTFPSFQKWLKE